MCHLPWVTSSITPVMVMSSTSCLEQGGTGASHLHACPSLESTQSSADFIITRIIFRPHGYSSVVLSPSRTPPCPLTSCWDLPPNPQQRSACESPKAEPGSGCWLQAGSRLAPGWLQALAPSWFSPPMPRASGSPLHPPQPLINGFQTQRDQLPWGKAVKHPEQRPLQLGSRITKSNPRAGMTLLPALWSFLGPHRH